ncbi:type III secretion system chaperone [Algicola sagamiensis]|uniref:type III secretion system chaperone n=1 Tax=Algicola sagamiensis TaxID=163869 RepID=UPI00036531EE|nr:type III secretion system chaperone [Algicola sagamiensis]
MSEEVIEQVNQWLNAFGQEHQAAFQLEEGVCAICCPHGNVVAVIEVPPHSDILVLHSQVADLRTTSEPGIYSALLTMNFQMDVMKGNWFSLHEGQVYLCTQRALKDLDEVRFSHVLTGFINESELWREKVLERLQQSSGPATLDKPAQWTSFV